MSESEEDLNVDLDSLVSELEAIDSNVASRLRKLSGAIQNATPGTISNLEIYQYIDLDALEEQATISEQRGWIELRWVEWFRNILVLIPVALTWIALSRASVNYSLAVSEDKDLLTQPFLALWEKGFEGHIDPHWADFFSGTFSTLALWDFWILIALIILTFIIHSWKDVKIVTAERAATNLRRRVEQYLWQLSRQNSNGQTIPDLPQALGNIAKALDTLPGQLKNIVDLFTEEQERLKKSADQQASQVQHLATFNSSLASFVDHSKQVSDIYGQIQDRIAKLNEQYEQSEEQQKNIVKSLNGINNNANSLITNVVDVSHRLESGMDILANAADKNTDNTTAVSAAAREMGEFAMNILDREGKIRDIISETNRSLQAATGQLVSVTKAFEVSSKQLAQELSSLSRETAKMNDTVYGRLSKIDRQLLQMGEMKQIGSRGQFVYLIGVAILILLIIIIGLLVL